MASHLKNTPTQHLFDCLKNDLEMLKNGNWIPDEDSIDASIDVVEELQQRLNTEKE